VILPASITADAAHDRMRLDVFISTRLAPEYSRSQVARMIKAGLVTVNGAAARASSGVRTGDRVEVAPPAVAESHELYYKKGDSPEISVIFADGEIIVVNKPAGMTVHPAPGHPDGTLVDGLLARFPELATMAEPDGVLRPGIVHRLDKDTSGVMVIAKHDAAHRKLAADWGTDRVRKEYLAVVYGTPKTERGKIEGPIGRDPRNRKRMSVVASGRSAITEYSVEEQLRYASLVRLRLRTGRTHQIRVHMKHLGHPIIGDPLYSGPQWRGIPDKRIQKAIASFPRQALHAARLTIPHPRTGEVMTFESPLPEDMRELLAALR